MPNADGQTLKRSAPPGRLASAVGASALLHILALALIGLNIARLTAPPLVPVRETEVWLYPLPPLEHVKPHRPSTPAKTRASEERPKPQARPAGPAPKAAAPRSATATPNVPSPLAGAAVPSGQTAQRGASSENPDGVAEALRTSVGCDAEHVVHLTPGERDKCAQKFGETARRGQPFAKPVDRGFAAQAAADERRRRDREGPLQDNVKACEGEGSNFGEGCLSERAIIHVPQR